MAPMKHIFEEEFRNENPQLDFDNDILGPYTRWLEAQLLEARKQLAINAIMFQSSCSCSKVYGIDHDEDGKPYCIGCGCYLE